VQAPRDLGIGQALAQAGQDLILAFGQVGAADIVDILSTARPDDQLAGSFEERKRGVGQELSVLRA